MVGIALLGLSVAPAAAQSFPSAPVKFITQVAAGSGPEPAMRIVIDQLGKRWGQQVVLVNQPGAGGAISARAAASASPDGYTLYMAAGSIFSILPELQPNLPFNVSDFVPIGFVGEIPLAIAASPELPVSSLPALIEYSKKQPGGLSMAVPNCGGIPHLAIELIRSLTQADLTFVYYPGSAQAMSDVISGRVQAVIDGIASPIAKGQLKVLAVTSSSRVPSYASVPTVSENLPGFAATGWFALVAPPGTPASIVSKLSDDLRAVLAQDDIKQRFAALSLSTRSMSPAELDQFVRAERELWRPVVKRVSAAAQ